MKLLVPDYWRIGGVVYRGYETCVLLIYHRLQVLGGMGDRGGTAFIMCPTASLSHTCDVFFLTILIHHLGIDFSRCSRLGRTLTGRTSDRYGLIGRITC